MHVFLRKSPLCRSHFFEWLKTVISSNACGTSTLKSPLLRAFFTPHVHQRLRKRPPRCTLDCGSKTSESPALRGFEAGPRALATAALYLVLLSNGLHLSKNFPVKFGFSPKPIPANIAKKLPPQRCSKLLFIAVFQLLTQTPYIRFHERKWVHTRLSEKDRTQRHTRRNRGRFGWGRYYYPRSVLHGSETLRGRVSERRTLPLWDLGREVLPKNAESLRNSDALMRVAVPRRRGPAGLRDLFATW